MRYWIYWNDLVQGPFDVSELVSLKAFAADLLVCPEDQQEWVPAAAVTELLPYFQPVEVPRGGPPAPPPPPPPNPPTLTPLQGEFFSEAAGQEPLFDLNGSKNFAFRPALDAPDVSDYRPPPFSTPFHFAVFGSAAPAEPISRPVEIPRIPFILPPEPIPEPERPHVEESGLGVAEPEVSHALEQPVIEIPPPTPILTPPPVRKPISIPDFTPPRREPPPENIFRPTPAFEPEAERKTRLWPWVLGVWVTMGLVGAGFYLYSGHRPAPAVMPPVPVEPPPVITPPIRKPIAIAKPAVKKSVRKPDVKPAPKPVVKPLEPVPERVQAVPGMMTPDAPTGLNWRGKEQDAIDLVLKKKIYAGKRTIGDNAVLMMEEMHEKELLHAAETGERLYQPDKVSWSALHADGSSYRVYLNYMAWNAAGERILARSDQFVVELQRKTVLPADEATRAEFFDAAAMRSFQSNVKAADIQTVLNGVDVVNKQKLRAVILKAAANKEEKKKAESSLQAAEAKLQKEIVYFRTKYAEKTLQNIAQAYKFTEIMKGK